MEIRTDASLEGKEAGIGGQIDPMFLKDREGKIIRTTDAMAFAYFFNIEELENLVRDCGL